MERDEKPGSVSWTGITGQPLLPGETPMRALGASQDVLRGRGNRRLRWRGAAGQANCFAANHLEPCSPDATAWPIFPEHRSKGQRWRLVDVGGRAIRGGGGGERPNYCTHPSRLNRGGAFLTLRTQRTGATMAAARGIQDSQRAIAFGTPFLGIQRAAGRATQCPIRLKGKGRAGKAAGKRRPCPLGRTIRHRRWVLRDGCR